MTPAPTRSRPPAPRREARNAKPGPPITRVVLYVKDIEAVARFYERHFRLRRIASDERGWLELSGGSGCTIALHQAARSQRSGAAIKIVFGIRNVASFKAKSAIAGLKFGPIHRANGIAFANAKDPAGNSISVSNRGVP
ncbi:MAG: VOC family protein [Phycisphaeraceae bacterium]|nr:VOC family protein [Phycisphaeraceae bacterium]